MRAPLAQLACRVLPLVAMGLSPVGQLAGTLLAATPLGARQTIDTQDLRRHVMFLASDTLEGRAAGTQGGRAAASYLAAEFRRLGLSPAGEGDDFLQEFGHGYRNVLALLPGSDPQLAKEAVLLGGHFDHVGYGRPGNSFGPFGQIHNGADDNASGTSAILEIAEAFSQLDAPPPRSVLFALWDAEEAGLLGSKHWAEHPTLPLEQVKLALNLDMVGRLRNERVTVYGVRTAAGLRRIASLANQNSRLALDFDRKQRKDSDHWTFYRRHIPYLMFHTGDHADYHRPSDDAPKLNYDGLQRLSRVVFEVTRTAATATNLAEFRSEVLNERPMRRREDSAPSSRLGIFWEPRREQNEPYVITRVADGSPAAQAGLQPGDQIVRFDGRAVTEIPDLAAAVLSSAGAVRLLIERNGESSLLEMQIALRGRPVRLGVRWRTDSAEPASLLITNVVPGSPAAQAGIQTGDRLYRSGEIPQQSAGWLPPLIASTKGPLALWAERDGKVRNVVVNLLPAPSTRAPVLAD